MSVKNVLKRIRYGIKSILPYVVGIALLLGGYIYSETHMIKMFSDEQYEDCKNIIYSIYEANDEKTIPLPANMYYDTEHTDGLRVGFKGYHGYARGTIINEKLVVEKENATPERVIKNILMAIVVWVLGELIIYIIDEKFFKGNEKFNK